MQHNPHKPIEYIIRVPLAFGFFGAGCVFCLSGLLMLYPFRTLSVFLLALMSILFGISAFASFGYSIRNLVTVVILDETGMTVRRFRSTKFHLPWEQIRFAGICTKHSYRGMQKRYCFAPRELSQQERDDLSLIDVPHVYFSWFSQAELNYIRAHSPVKPNSDAEQFLNR